jgi:hypothetical protein
MDVLITIVMPMSYNESAMSITMSPLSMRKETLQNDL